MRDCRHGEAAAVRNWETIRSAQSWMVCGESGAGTARGLVRDWDGGTRFAVLRVVRNDSLP